MSKLSVNQAAPVAAIVLAILAVFAEGYPHWVRLSAVLVGVLLGLGWLFSESGWLGKAIKFKLFPTKLTEDRMTRLSVLLDETSDILDESYTVSPFYVWRDCGNKYCNRLRFNYEYYQSLQMWFADLHGKFLNPAVDNFQLLDSLSKSIFQIAKMADYAEKELEQLIRELESTDKNRTSIQKEWEHVRTRFNGTIDKWCSLFKEIKKAHDLQCYTHFNVLKPLL